MTDQSSDLRAQAAALAKAEVKKVEAELRASSAQTAALQATVDEVRILPALLLVCVLASRMQSC